MEEKSRLLDTSCRKTQRTYESGIGFECYSETCRHSTSSSSSSAAPPFKPQLSMSFVLFSRYEKERTNGQVGYTKHIRLYGTSTNWPASFLLFFRFFFSLATLTRILRSSLRRQGGRRTELSRERGGRGQGASSLLAKLSHRKSLEVVL